MLSAIFHMICDELHVGTLTLSSLPILGGDPFRDSLLDRVQTRHRAVLTLINRVPLLDGRLGVTNVIHMFALKIHITL